MHKTIFAMLLAVFITTFPFAAVSATLNPPWKRITNNDNFEYWYDTSSVVKTGRYIDVNVWEIYRDDAAAIYKHIRFDKVSKLRGYGESRHYKNNNQTYDFDFSKMGYVFGKPQPDESKLFKLLNK